MQPVCGAGVRPAELEHGEVGDQEAVGGGGVEVREVRRSREPQSVGSMRPS